MIPVQRLQSGASGLNAPGPAGEGQDLRGENVFLQGTLPTMPALKDLKCQRVVMKIHALSGQNGLTGQFWRCFLKSSIDRLPFPARALRALGLLLADGAPTVGGGETF